MPDLTPAEWFDQFPPQPQMDSHAQWCGRHWAPCPVLHRSGVGALAEVIQIFVSEFAGGLHGADALNARLAETGRICCKLGDDRMYEIWARWPAADAAEVTGG